MAEYESIGGYVSVTQHASPDTGDGAQWLGMTFPRDPAGRGNAMLAELNDPSGEDAKRTAVGDWIVRTRGVT